jgi:hypothetical protein
LVKVEKKYNVEGLRDLPTGRQVEVDILFVFRMAAQKDRNGWPEQC